MILRAALALLAVLPTAPATGDVTWTVRTAANSYGADRSSFSYAVNPGGTATDAMVVANRGKTPLTLAVYTADGFTTGTGQLDLRAKADAPRGIGAWVRTGQPQVTVAPGGTASVPFTITVPGNATPGDYAGGIVTSLTQASTTETVNVERRLGIRIRLRVGGALAPALTIDHLHVGYHGSWNPFSKGDATVTYTIHNTGNAIQSAQQAVSVAGPFGLLRTNSAAVAAPPELLPGETWSVTAAVHGVAPVLRLGATATLTPRITDASGSTTSLDPVTATAHAWAVPWAVVLAVGLVVVLILLVRRSRVRRKRREDQRVEQAVAEALVASAAAK